MKEAIEFMQFRGVWMLVSKIMQKLHQEELVLFGAGHALMPLFFSRKLLSDITLTLMYEGSFHCRVVERPFENEQPLTKLQINFRSVTPRRGEWSPESPKLSIDFGLFPRNRLLSRFCWIVAEELGGEVNADPEVQQLIFEEVGTK